MKTFSDQNFVFPRGTLVGPVWFLSILVLAACSRFTSEAVVDPVEVVFDTPLAELAGGVRLAPPEAAWDGFGEAVDVAGELLVIGASDWNPCGSGSAYVYRYLDGEWLEEAQLTASDRDVFSKQARQFEGQRFGTSVAIGEGIIAVGAPGNGPPSAGGFPGAVYLFKYDGQDWMETAKLTASQPDSDSSQTQLNPSYCGRMRPRLFGALLALDGDTLAVVGDSVTNAVYIYQRGENGWLEQASIQLPGLPGRDLHMASLALHGDTLALSALYVPPQPEEALLLSGSVIVYVFERTGNEWQEHFQFSPEGGDTDLLFLPEVNIGASVALSGTAEQANLLAVGLPGFPDWTGELDPILLGANPEPIEFPESNRQTGAVYLIERGETGEWNQQATLKPAGWENPPGPGSFSPGTLSHLEEEQGDTGEAVFNTPFVFPGDLFSADPEISFFGTTVDLDGNQLAVTAGFANATYVFEHDGQDWAYRFRITAGQEGDGLWEDSAQVVAISGDTLLLGTPSEFGNSAHVFGLTAVASDP